MFESHLLSFDEGIADDTRRLNVRFPPHPRHYPYPVRAPIAVVSQAHKLAERMAALGKSAWQR